MLSYNQIAGIFDHQYLWKESINNLQTLHGLSYQVKVASETATFVTFTVTCSSWSRADSQFKNSLT